MNSEKTNQPEEQAKPKAGWRKFTLPILLILGVIIVGVGSWYFIDQSKYIYTDNAAVSAPLIQLTPSDAGVLKMVFVKEGDTLRAHEPVARVGSEMISTEVAGTAVTVNQDVGANYNPGQPVVTMIQPDQLRIVAQIAEDKGFNDIHVGQNVHFTVDAYGSQQFNGTVEAVAQTNHAGDVVFNISDKRQEQDYEIKIAYDPTSTPRFENGMSARVWIIK